MSVSGASLSAPVDRSIPDQTTPQFTYEYVDGGFYYMVAHSTRGREFVSLPGFTATQVQELFELGKIFPPENLDGNESFGFAHGWQVYQNKVGIVAEEGVLCCTVYDETGKIISDEKILQTDDADQPVSAGKIFSRYFRSTPFIYSDDKVRFYRFIRQKEGDDALSTWEWENKTLSLLRKDGQCIWQLFDRVTKKTHCIALANIWLENPDENFYEERIYYEFPPECCPKFLLERDRVNIGQLLECATDEKMEQALISRISKLIQTYYLKISVTSDHQLQEPVFRPPVVTTSAQSRLDSNIAVTESRWAVTLVNSKPPDELPHGHAVLLIEKFKEGQYKMMIAHFVPNVPSGKKEMVFKILPGRVEYKEVDPSFYFHSKTETWSLPRLKVKQMIAESKSREIQARPRRTPCLFQWTWTCNSFHACKH